MTTVLYKELATHSMRRPVDLRCCKTAPSTAAQQSDSGCGGLYDLLRLLSRGSEVDKEPDFPSRQSRCDNAERTHLGPWCHQASGGAASNESRKRAFLVHLQRSHHQLSREGWHLRYY